MENKENASIEVKGFGQTEAVDFEHFAIFVVQEETVALEEARRLLEGEDVICVNSDQPEFYHEFRLLNRNALIKQIEAAGFDLEV